MRPTCVAALIAAVLSGCSVDIDTGGEEPRPRPTGDATVNRLKEYDARQKASEEPGERTYRKLVKLNAALTRLTAQAERGRVWRAQRDPDIAFRARKMTARMRRVRADAPPLSNTLRAVDLRVGKANENMAERLADVAESPNRKSWGRYKASYKEWRRVTKEANEDAGAE